MISPASDADFETIYRIVNDAARAYEGVIPADCYHRPYMTREELRREIDDGVAFWGYRIDGDVSGVMGIQDVRDVTLIRHAYVAKAHQGRGIGSALIRHLLTLTDRPTLVGTWQAAEWAVRFYERHGFVLVSPARKNLLLQKYWNISSRQVETSVVLADRRWLDLNTP